MVKGEKQRIHKKDMGYLQKQMELLKIILMDERDGNVNKKMSMSKYVLREQFSKVKRLKDLTSKYLPQFFIYF